MSARAPRARDHRRRDVVRAGRPVGGPLAARADAPASAVGGRDRRGRGGLPRLRRSTPRRPASRSSSCTPPTGTCSRSSCRRRPTSAPAPTRSRSGRGSSAGSRTAIRRSAPELILGIRLSIDGEREGGFSLDGLCELLPAISPLVDYVSVTVGVRTTYVRDMATTEPPLLGAIDRLRPVVDRPLLVSQAFRRADSIEAALAAGADLVGVARPLIADPDFPAKVSSGRAEEIRPCVSCNEDCRAFDPVLLCSVNPDLGPSRQGPRPAAPLLARPGAPSDARAASRSSARDRPGSSALSRCPREHEVVAVRRRRATGRTSDDRHQRTEPARMAVAAGLLRARDRPRRATSRSTWGRSPARNSSRGSTTSWSPSAARRCCPTLPGVEHALSSSRFIGQRSPSSAGDALVIVDDGFGWWPCASAVETGDRRRLGRASRC